MSVVPVDEEADLAAKGSPIQRHENATQRLALHGPHEPLDHRDAAVFLDGPETLADASAPAPIAEALVGELRPLIRDEMGRSSARLSNRPAEHLAGGDACRILGEYCEAHDAP